MNPRRAIALFGAVLGLFPVSAIAAPVRVASYGLCADQMVLMLAPREQIAAVSPQATGPLSHYAARARGIPATRGSAEEILASGARLLVTSDMMDKRTMAALDRFGIAVLPLPFANDWAEITAMTRDVAEALGRPERGEAVIADMRATLAAARPSEPRGHWPSIIYYRPDGGGAGGGTFVDAALQAAGYRNLQAEWGPPGWGGVPLERVIGAPPSAFAVSYFDGAAPSSTVLRRNPLLWGKAQHRPILSVPGKYWNCGSPLLAEAVKWLAARRGPLRARMTGGA